MVVQIIQEPIDSKKLYQEFEKEMTLAKKKMKQINSKMSQVFLSNNKRPLEVETPQNQKVGFYNPRNRPMKLMRILNSASKQNRVIDTAKQVRNLLTEVSYQNRSVSLPRVASAIPFKVK